MEENFHIEREGVPFTIIADPIFDDPRVGKNELLVYITLCKFANKDRDCWPGLNKIAEVARCGRSTVQEAVKTLVMLGYVDKQVRKKRGGYRSSLYKVYNTPKGSGNFDGGPDGGVPIDGPEDDGPNADGHQDPDGNVYELPSGLPEENYTLTKNRAGTMPEAGIPESGTGCTGERHRVYRRAVGGIPESGKELDILTNNTRTRIREQGFLPGKSRDRVKLRGKITYPEEFERFWREYPKPLDKRETYVNWTECVENGATADELLTAAKKYSLRSQTMENRFVKGSKSFLGEGEPWRDALEYSDGLKVRQSWWDCPVCGDVIPTALQSCSMCGYHVGIEEEFDEWRSWCLNNAEKRRGTHGRTKTA